MKRVFFSMLMIALMAFSNLALAQKDEYKTLVLDVFEAQNTKQSLKVSLNATLGPICEKLELNEEQKKGLTDIIISTVYDDLMDKAVELYKENFSLKEIKSINTFYKSPTGKKLGELTPELSQGLITKLTEDEDFVNKIQSAVLLYVLAVKMKEVKDDENFNNLQSEDFDDDTDFLIDYPTE